MARAARRWPRRGSASARAEAELLAAYVLGVPRGRLALADGFDAGRAATGSTALVGRRAGREPLQHLTGRAGFRHLELAVGPGVFVPRPETELLAGWGIEQAPTPAPRRWWWTCAAARARSRCRWPRRCRRPGWWRWSGRRRRWPGCGATPRAGRRGGPADRGGGRRRDRPGAAGRAGRPGGRAAVQPAVRAAAVAVPPEVAGHDPAEAVFGGADGLAVIRPVIGARRRAAAPRRGARRRARRHARRGGAGRCSPGRPVHRGGGAPGPGRPAPVRHRVPAGGRPARRRRRRRGRLTPRDALRLSVTRRPGPRHRRCHRGGQERRARRPADRHGLRDRRGRLHPVRGEGAARRQGRRRQCRRRC